MTVAKSNIQDNYEVFCYIRDSLSTQHWKETEKMKRCSFVGQMPMYMATGESFDFLYVSMRMAPMPMSTQV